MQREKGRFWRKHMDSHMHARRFISLYTHTHSHVWQSAFLMCICKVTLWWSQDQKIHVVSFTVPAFSNTRSLVICLRIKGSYAPPPPSFTHTYIPKEVKYRQNHRGKKGKEGGMKGNQIWNHITCSTFQGSKAREECCIHPITFAAHLCICVCVHLYI